MLFILHWQAVITKKPGVYVCTGCAGVAYIGAFDTVDATGTDWYKPALVFYDELGPGVEKWIAEAISHEVLMAVTRSNAWLHKYAGACYHFGCCSICRRVAAVAAGWSQREQSTQSPTRGMHGGCSRMVPLHWQVGHNGGLHHDGAITSTPGGMGYYPGHGSGPTGWAPIMGVGYGQALVQVGLRLH